MKRFLLSLGLLPFLAGLAFGQASVQQAAQQLTAATVVGTSATSAATVTITVPQGQFFYLTGVDIVNCAGASAVTAAAVTSITTTNMGGVAWTIGSGVTAGLCQPAPVTTFGPAGLKSAAAGTNATFVLPTFATNQTIRLNVYGYFSP